MDFKKGDRVVAKQHHLGHQREGTVKVATGVQYWVLFDGDDKLTPNLPVWWLEPLAK